jgi:AcrR family transcriptional regulator
VDQPIPGESTHRRDEILDTALRLFARDGFAATGIRAIAGEVGIREATIYHYFRSKEEILEAIMDRSATRQAEGVHEAIHDLGLDETLYFLGTGFLAAMAERSSRDVVHVMMLEASHSPGLAERYLRDFHDHWIDLVEAVIAKHTGSGGEVSPRTAARAFSGALVAFVLHDEALAEVAGRPLRDNLHPDRDQYLTELVTMIVRGIKE